MASKREKAKKRKEWLKAVADADAIRKKKRNTNKFALGGKHGQPSNAETTGSQVLMARGTRNRKPHGLCCIEATGGDRPSYFRECPDCPNKKVDDL